MNYRIFLFALVSGLVISCSLPQPKRNKMKARSKAKQTEMALPVLIFEDTLDHFFTLTNKQSGLFSGHCKSANSNSAEGW